MEEIDAFSGKKSFKNRMTNSSLYSLAEETSDMEEQTVQVKKCASTTKKKRSSKFTCTPVKNSSHKATPYKKNGSRQEWAKQKPQPTPQQHSTRRSLFGPMVFKVVPLLEDESESAVDGNAEMTAAWEKRQETATATGHVKEEEKEGEKVENEEEKEKKLKQIEEEEGDAEWEEDEEGEEEVETQSERREEEEEAQREEGVETEASLHDNVHSDELDESDDFVINSKFIARDSLGLVEKRLSRARGSLCPSANTHLGLSSYKSGSPVAITQERAGSYDMAQSRKQSQSIESRRAKRHKPYSLRTDARGDMAKEAFKNQLEMEELERKRMREFKANTAYVKALRQPQPLNKSTRPLTEVQGLVLHSTVRAEERAKFDNHVHELELKRKAEQELIAAEEFKQLQQEIKELRRSMVHKSQPIRGQSPPRPPRPSSVALTDPKTPQFAKPKSKAKRPRLVKGWTVSPVV